MARPIKKGLEYFPFDVDFFEDKKIKILKSRYGADGILVYLYIICQCYKDNGYYLIIDNDFNYLIADELNMSNEKIQQILEYLFSRSLLVKIDSILTTSVTVITATSIQRRFQEAVRERAKNRVVEINKNLWLLSDEETASYIKFTHLRVNSEETQVNSEKTQVNSEFSTQRKEKKSKEKESKVLLSAEALEKISTYTSNKIIQDKLVLFFNNRAALRKDNCTQVIALILNALSKYSNNSNDLMIEIIDKSLRGGYVDFYPLKNNYSENKKQNNPGYMRSETRVRDEDQFDN